MLDLCWSAQIGFSTIQLQYGVEANEKQNNRAFSQAPPLLHKKKLIDPVLFMGLDTFGCHFTIVGRHTHNHIYIYILKDLAREKLYYNSDILGFRAIYIYI